MNARLNLVVTGLAVIASTMLQGCAIGAFAMYPKDKTTMHPSFLENSPKSTEDFPFHEYAYPEYNGLKGITSCSMLINKWGEPDSVVVQGNEKILDYKYGFVWGGFGFALGLALPIPVGIPVGRKHVVISCIGDEIVSSKDRWTYLGGAACGWAVVMGGCGLGELRFISYPPDGQ